MQEVALAQTKWTGSGSTDWSLNKFDWYHQEPQRNPNRRTYILRNNTILLPVIIEIKAEEQVERSPCDHRYGTDNRIDTAVKSPVNRKRSSILAFFLIDNR